MALGVTPALPRGLVVNSMFRRAFPIQFSMSGVLSALRRHAGPQRGGPCAYVTGADGLSNLPSLKKAAGDPIIFTARLTATMRCGLSRLEKKAAGSSMPTPPKKLLFKSASLFTVRGLSELGNRPRNRPSCSERFNTGGSGDHTEVVDG